MSKKSTYIRQGKEYIHIHMLRMLCVGALKLHNHGWRHQARYVPSACQRSEVTPADARYRAVQAREGNEHKEGSCKASPL